ncbi:MAG: response regulator transcription factor [Deltaproteobacteria bacterium]|nr:response regulator transcription factor [Deltaproteobacteria bacterium]
MATVLLVEDDPSILRGLEMNLKIDGLRVLSATDGVAAVRAARAAMPDLIILDLGLPSMDGFDVLREVRKDDPDVPILVLSARASEAEKVLGLSLGADDYVTKPFGLAELLARVRALLRRTRRREADAVVAFGPVSIDVVARVVRVNNEPVEVTALEFDLLRYLTDQPMRAVTREQIMQAVWGAGHAGTPRTVDNFIARLRSKIGDDPADPKFIETVRGVGYRFNPG